MQKLTSLTALAVLLALGLAEPATASPVSAKDLVGKKICWPNGNISTFGSGGKYSSPMVGEGTWSIYPGGVTLQTAKFNGVLDIDKQSDGTFMSNREGGVGKYCK
jgi:hypothetical protein